MDISSEQAFHRIKLLRHMVPFISYNAEIQDVVRTRELPSSSKKSLKFPSELICVCLWCRNIENENTTQYKYKYKAVHTIQLQTQSKFNSIQIQSSTIQYNTIQLNTIQFQYNTIQYNYNTK